MNLKEIEERVEKGLRNELPEALTWDQCKQLISRVKKLESVGIYNLWKKSVKENTKLRERNKELEDAIAVIKKANLRSIAALGEEHSEPRAKISPEEFEKFCKGLVWGKNENMGTSER